eukprot:CAMPEP_0184685732 /NCGR_PEP_ID=MMETSP0312-20130426/19959_1 /TAXON_ID=31354 /ORGANISM="Compsopogon coeruleus, Strain SAG 36.94" /LENGTH=148 /DNA_ID=CAMNT_0027140115 /DNA_START=130 /DNA_END=573 /DNA_ORIENTATION=-
MRSLNVEFFALPRPYLYPHHDLLMGTTALWKCENQRADLRGSKLRAELGIRDLYGRSKHHPQNGGVTDYDHFLLRAVTEPSQELAAPCSHLTHGLFAIHGKLRILLAGNHGKVDMGELDLELGQRGPAVTKMHAHVFSNLLHGEEWHW